MSFFFTIISHTITCNVCLHTIHHRLRPILASPHLHSLSSARDGGQSASTSRQRGGQKDGRCSTLYGSKPSPSKPQSIKKAPRHSMGGVNRRVSMGGATMQAPKTDILHSKNVRAAKRTEDIAHLSPGKQPLSGFMYCRSQFLLFVNH